MDLAFIYLGIITVVRSVAAHLSTEQERVKIMSLVSFFQALGFTMGPGKNDT